MLAIIAARSMFPCLEVKIINILSYPYFTPGVYSTCYIVL